MTVFDFTERDAQRQQAAAIRRQMETARAAAMKTAMQDLHTDLLSFFAIRRERPPGLSLESGTLVLKHGAHGISVKAVDQFEFEIGSLDDAYPTPLKRLGRDEMMDAVLDFLDSRDGFAP